MEVVYERCCGVDVHKKMVVACLRTGKENTLREFGTTTRELRRLADWLITNECQIVAMESTGSYWKPIYNVLEYLALDIMVVNAQHMKAVPGRKTDVKDAQWIADLLQHGLLRASFIPDRAQRELRDATRHRKNLIQNRAQEKNHLEKMLEASNIKLSSVVKDLCGVSSQNVLREAMNGTLDMEHVDKLLYGQVRKNKDQVIEAMEGAIITPGQRDILRLILLHIEFLTQQIDEMDGRIDADMQKYEEAVCLLSAIPGIGRVSAQAILAEIGLDMSRFPTAAHLASWAGVSPGNNESAGKRKHAKTTKGNKTLKTTLVQSAASGSKVKISFFHAQYERLVVRRGKKRAFVAVAHSMLIAIYHILKNGVPFKDLGSDYYNRYDTQRKIKYYQKKVEELSAVLPVPVSG